VNSKQLDTLVARRYKAAPGARYNDAQAQVIGCEFEAMQGEGVPVTPPNIVDRARPKKACLHPYFTWDDREAAEKYRHKEAADLMNHLVIVTEHENTRLERKVAFNVRVAPAPQGEEEPPARVYVSLAEATANEAYRQQLLAERWSILRHWAKVTEDLELTAEFADILELIHRHGK
jgi:hypothetical protein